MNISRTIAITNLTFFTFCPRLSLKSSVKSLVYIVISVETTGFIFGTAVEKSFFFFLGEGDTFMRRCTLLFMEE